MAHDDCPASVLAALGQKYRNGAFPSPHDMETLLQLCRTTRSDLREAALSLLLHPPVSHEGAYHEALAGHLMAGRKPAGSLPLPLLELLLDRIALTGKMPRDREQQEFFIGLLQHLPRQALDQLFQKRFPLEPFLRHIPPVKLLEGHPKARKELKRRWRLLKTRLFSLPESPGWCRITLRDLKNLRGRRRGGKLRALPAGAWILHARPLFFPCLSSVPPGFALTMPASFWGGSGSAALRAFETLLSAQAEELRRVRTLARTISRSTRRVVLSWHNASLAAAGGWAHEDLSHFFPTPALFQSFQEKVWRDLQTMCTKTDSLREASIGHLWALWEKRIVHQKILHACRESRVRAALDRSFREGWERDVAAARSFLGGKALQGMAEGGRYSSQGMVSPHQRFSIRAIEAWRQERLAGWREGLLRLVALLRQGQKLLDAGQLDCFVLPWIDKFFISSRREEDREYLPALLQWLELFSIQPLILFWEDTAHAFAPSFQLALQRLQERGCPFRGIGIFDPGGGTRREDAEEIICREHYQVRLFALRPHSDTYYRQALSELLQGNAGHFCETYDSAWKDDLCFIYTGTQVLPLLSVQCEMEPFAPWLAFQGVKYPFGSWLRQHLRREVLGQKALVQTRLSKEYFAWANLF